MDEIFNTQMHIYEQSVRKMHRVAMVALSSARLMLMGKKLKRLRSYSYAVSKTTSYRM